MDATDPAAQEGDLAWRLSSHPITLITFLIFRTSSLVVYLLGTTVISSSLVFNFIITMLLLAIDFYYLKNIAGRRLVGLRWWNEVNPTSGDSHWVFESQDRSSGAADGTPRQNKTDKRFFWLALYAQPALWIVLAVLALVRFASPIWLALNAIALVLTLTNTVAFSRCDKFSQATSLASTAFYSGGLAKSVAGGLFGKLFAR